MLDIQHHALFVTAPHALHRHRMYVPTYVPSHLPFIGYGTVAELCPLINLYAPFYWSQGAVLCEARKKEP